MIERLLFTSEKPLRVNDTHEANIWLESGFILIKHICFQHHFEILNINFLFNQTIVGTNGFLGMAACFAFLILRFLVSLW
jgi:hypothetical protein